MRRAETVENLRSFALPPSGGGFLGLLLRWEAWLDARRSRRALYALDERALADIGLTHADLRREDPASWHRHLKNPARPDDFGGGNCR